MLRCSVCGDELTEEMNVCPGCGVSLKAKKVTASAKEKAEEIPAVEKSGKKSKKGEKNLNVKETPVKPNSISSTKLFYLFFFLAIAGLLLIYASGVFDSAPSSNVVPQGNQSSQPGGVDLNNLEQINSLQAVVDKNPGDKESLLQLAHMYNDSGMKEKAILRYTQYLKMDPRNTDVLVDMGVCYFETGKNDMAIASMEKALKINPRHQIANLNLGIVNMSAGNPEKAKVYWKTANEIDPTNEIGQKAKELLTTH
jgi:tetratricopeptide (TPR) repeat protein